MTRLLVLLVLAGVVAYPVFARARDHARGSPRARARAITRAVIGLLAGCALALWLPRRVPETSGSPASLVAMVLLWIIGGSLVFLSVAALAGAIAARPDRYEA